MSFPPVVVVLIIIMALKVASMQAVELQQAEEQLFWDVFIHMSMQETVQLTT